MKSRFTIFVVALAVAISADAQSATFTWASEGGTGSRTRFDNIALTGTVNGGPDITAPTPNPMTWASVPVAVSAIAIAITMTATTTTDPRGVEYRFTRYAADGTSPALGRTARSIPTTPASFPTRPTPTP